MKSLLVLGLACVAVVAPAVLAPAHAQHPDYNAMVAAQAEAHGVPESLIHRVIKREIGYRPHLIGRGGTIGLMQIKLATARGLGYTGTAEGLRDPATNMTYAVKYLAGAFLAARGDHNRAVSYYASGYYYAAKRNRAAREALAAAPKPAAPVAANAAPVPVFHGSKPETAKP